MLQMRFGKPSDCLSMGGNKALAFRRNLQDTFNAVVRTASAFDHVDLARMARTLCHSTQGLQAGTCEGLQSVARPDALKALAFRRGSFTWNSRDDVGLPDFRSPELAWHESANRFEQVCPGTPSEDLGETLTNLRSERKTLDALDPAGIITDSVA